MPKPTPSVRDIRGLEAALSDQQAGLDRMGQEDQMFDATRRLMLRSPNGTFWAVVVSDTGVLSTVNMGTSL